MVLDLLDLIQNLVLKKLLIFLKIFWSLEVNKINNTLLRYLKGELVLLVTLEIWYVNII